MKLVTLTSDGINRFGTPETVRKIARAGFDAYDCTLCHMTRKTPEGERLAGPDYMKWAKEVKDAADEFGIPCTQTHSIFPTLTDINNTDTMLYYTLRCMEISAYLGADIVVVHPGNNYGPQDNYKYLYEKILPEAEKLNIRIATENMWNTIQGIDHFEAVPAACGTSSDFAAHIDIAQSNRLVACVDIGHAEMKNSEGAANMIRALGHDRVKALHVHDNDCLHDSHVAPFAGQIKWDPVIEALRDIDYDGNFTYEADSWMPGLPDELFSAKLEFLEKTGRYFIQRLQK